MPLSSLEALFDDRSGKHYCVSACPLAIRLSSPTTSTDANQRVIARGVVAYQVNIVQTS